VTNNIPSIQEETAAIDIWNEET